MTEWVSRHGYCKDPSSFISRFLWSEALANGPAAFASAYVPDKHAFQGSFGGKDVTPLWRDAGGIEPNVARGLLEVLSKEYGSSVSPEDLIAYIYALFGGQSYTRRFWNELETPGPRVPLTKDGVCKNF